MMKKYKNGNGEVQVPNILAQGTRLTGTIESEGDVRIDGWMSGAIIAKGKVVIGEKGYLEGEITCLRADISGEVKANVQVKELTVLKASAKVYGDITTQKISIEPGALFTGKCVMDKAPKINLDGKETKGQKKSA